LLSKQARDLERDPCPRKQYCVRSVACTRAIDPASESGRAADMSGSTGDAICKVQKIAPTMNPARSLAVHAPEDRADKKSGRLILLHGELSHDDCIGDMI
jgi:hypothetical protein